MTELVLNPTGRDFGKDFALASQELGVCGWRLTREIRLNIKNSKIGKPKPLDVSVDA